MRTVLFLAALPLALLGCSHDDESDRNAEAAVAAGFRPPTVLGRADFGMDLDKRFDRLDVNGDSILERNEWPPRYADRIAELDKNKDGKVTSGEFFDALMARFDAADTNHDQVLTSEERAAADIPKDQGEDDADGDIANATEAAATNQSGTP
ncbi:hypothetical protein DFR49_2329 [Hephaestia caeni]|uniref:EF-hand domain-containing protein n=1 Tax=Hephaestia caeni TaxID=645617 RepID=A0A397P4B8_9SPHN|nr:hypothetical protein [Hephaestia caeni]RIA44092.1 hypothetical protein DFR49_2329 [Hephaestia caeni]